jgi:NADPH:quinone reductase-like Zn-dependent oxidoreductase
MFDKHRRSRHNGVCSTKNVELVRFLDADRIIDYTCEDFTQGKERYDLLLDNVGNRPLSAMKRVLSQNGKCGSAEGTLAGVDPIGGGCDYAPTFTEIWIRKACLAAYDFGTIVARP